MPIRGSINYVMPFPFPLVFLLFFFLFKYCPPFCLVKSSTIAFLFFLKYLFMYLINWGLRSLLIKIK